MIRYAAACIVTAFMLSLSPALPIWAAPASSEGTEIHGDVPAGTQTVDLGKLSAMMVPFTEVFHWTNPTGQSVQLVDLTCPDCLLQTKITVGEKSIVSDHLPPGWHNTRTLELKPGETAAIQVTTVGPSVRAPHMRLEMTLGVTPALPKPVVFTVTAEARPLAYYPDRIDLGRTPIGTLFTRDVTIWIDPVIDPWQWQLNSTGSFNSIGASLISSPPNLQRPPDVPPSYVARSYQLSLSRFAAIQKYDGSLSLSARGPNFRTADIEIPFSGEITGDIHASCYVNLSDTIVVGTSVTKRVLITADTDEAYRHVTVYKQSLPEFKTRYLNTDNQELADGELGADPKSILLSKSRHGRHEIWLEATMTPLKPYLLYVVPVTVGTGKNEMALWFVMKSALPAPVQK